MRALKISLIGCGFFVLVAGLVYGTLLFLRPITLPVYLLDQQVRPGQDAATSTLSYGGDTYESGAEENALELTAIGFNPHRRIGKTQDGMDVYAISGQDPSDFLMLTTLMFPSMIFRNSSLPPVQLTNTGWDELQIQSEMGGSPTRSTADRVIVQEVIETLSERANPARSLQVPRVGFIRLVSKHLPGLGYSFYAATGPDGSVYLAEKTDPDTWIPAGPAFTGWVRQP